MELIEYISNIKNVVEIFEFVHFYLRIVNKEKKNHKHFTTTKPYNGKPISLSICHYPKGY